MDFSWSDTQLAKRDEAAEFGRSLLTREEVRAFDAEGRFPRDAWERCAEFGLLGLSVPPEYGGTDVDLTTAVLVMEGLGKGCPDNGLAFALNAQIWTVQLPIVRFGTDEQKARFLPDLCGGRSIGAHALTEPESGSDAFALSLTAEKVDDGYVLNGTKHLISLGPIADIALVFAATNPDAGQWGVSAFLVERDRPGFFASETQHKMGLRTVPLGELRFEDCRIPEANRLGPEGAGVSISNHSLELERCCILASQIGAMERQLDESIEYAKTREQFGQPVGKFQSVSNRIADMKLRLETARLLLYKVAWLISNDRPAMMEAALLKLYLSESFAASSLDAVRVHGGRGYLHEHDIERDLRDSVGGLLYAGTSDIQRNIISRLLGL